MRQGDLVIRKSYGGDVIFKIQQIVQQQALLKGVDYRLLADAPINDLSAISQQRFSRHEQTIQPKVDEALKRMGQFRQQQSEKSYEQLPIKGYGRHPYFEVPGKVLHLDGDSMYLRKSMQLYNELRVPAEGIYVPEANMAEVVFQLLPQVKPDILVLTGHDGILKQSMGGDMQSLSNYKNSHNFVNAVKMARQFERNRDALIIIAGACQSHFEALLLAGANFASSPARVLIHALDPLYIAAKVAFTSIKDTVHIMDVLQHTLSGLEGIGGIETRGSYRLGLPGMKKAVVKQST